MCLLLGYVNIFLLFLVVTLGFKVDTYVFCVDNKISDEMARQGPPSLGSKENSGAYL